MIYTLPKVLAKVAVILQLCQAISIKQRCCKCNGVRSTIVTILLALHIHNFLVIWTLDMVSKETFEV